MSNTCRRAKNVPHKRALVPIAEDLEWLRDYWAGDPDKLSDADVRRGGATLRRLLIERGQGAIMFAWRALGFGGQPTVVGPDLLALMEQLGHTVERTAVAVAGGVPVSGVVYAAFGAHRVDNPETGVSADADEGFAVAVGSIAHRLPEPGEEVPGSPFDANAKREWRLMDYLDAPGGIRKGEPVRRRDIIQFYCKDGGAVHMDELFGAERGRTKGELLAAELDKHVFTDWRNGLALEVLAIGHALGRSDDIAKLASSIRVMPDDEKPR
jgi:hypothetical protein